MGNKAVKGLKDEMLRPRLFGDAGAADSLRGVYYERAGRRESVATVGETMIDMYNAESGDRKMRIKTGDIVTAATASLKTTLGPVIALGTENGRLIIHEFETLSIKKYEMVPTPSEASSALGKKPAIDRADSSARRTSSTKRSGRVAVTALAFSGKNAIFVGLSNGVVKMYTLNEESKAKLELKAPTVTLEESKSPSDEEGKEATTTVDLDDEGTSSVVGLGVLKRSVAGGATTACLAVAHSSGELHWYNAATGEWIEKKKSKQPLSGIAVLHKLQVVIGYHYEQNKVTIFDVKSGKGGIWDFTPEHSQVSRKNSKTSSVIFDESRSMLFVGCDDGSIFVRKVERDQSDRISIKLHRLSHPSSSAVAPGRVTCMWYDAQDDTLFTGDLSGYARVVDNATGILYAETEEGRELEAERERRGSRVGLQPVALRYGVKFY